MATDETHEPHLHDNLIGPPVMREPGERIKSPVQPLIGPDEPAAVEVVNPDGAAPIVVLCDHACNRIPHALDQLGLPEDTLQQHVAHDIGSAAVGRTLAILLDSPLLLARYSRLVIDLNRFPDDSTSIARVSDGIVVPGNHGLTVEQVRQRAQEFFHPYHDRVRDTLDQIRNRGIVPAIISVHSFTPVFADKQRPWHIGILKDRDTRIAQPLLERLRRHNDLCVGDNEPYHAREPLGYTMSTHCQDRGLPHVLLEIRQDLIADPANAQHWAGRIYEELAPILEDTEFEQL